MSEQEQHDLMTEMMLGEYDYARPRRGEIREAVILSIGENDIVVDLGAKRDGIIAPRDLQQVDPEFRQGLQVGDHIPVAILRTWGDEDGIPVSLSRGLQQQDWLRAETLLESGELVEAEVLEYNRGGVIVSFGRLNGFVPNSHLGALPSGSRQGRDQDPKADLVGKTLTLAVIEVNQPRRRLVLSKRAADRRRRHELLAELEEGQIRRGVVRNLVDFGAFVDLGGIDGLIHISELDWQHVERPGDVLRVGDEVEVQVLSVDRERERIGLSRKRLLPDPWSTVTSSLAEGQTVDGVVTSIVSFGMFVDVGSGVEGLVHTSEMGGIDPQSVGTGTRVSVEVLQIDHAQHQIALRLVDVYREPEEWGGAEDLDEREQA
jgi:small subunit ribosomal protein S1